MILHFAPNFITGLMKRRYETKIENTHEEKAQAKQENAGNDQALGEEIAGIKRLMDKEENERERKSILPSIIHEISFDSIFMFFRWIWSRLLAHNYWIV